MNQRYRFKIQDFDIVQNSEEKQMVSSTTESDKNERISDQNSEHLLFEDQTFQIVITEELDEAFDISSEEDLGKQLLPQNRSEN